MIELYNLEGEQFDLASDEVTIELNNSLFNDGLSFKGSLSYPINLAFTPKNKKLLSFCDQLEVHFKTANIPVQVRLGAKIFKKCTLNISVSEQFFVGSLKLDIGRISERIREVRLSDIPFKSFWLGTTTAEIRNNMLAASVNTNWRTLPYTFIPTKNVDFLKNTNTVIKPEAQPKPLIRSLPEEYYKTNPQPPAPPIINAFIGDLFYFQDANSTPVVPYFYLSYVLNQIAEWLGLSLKGDFAVHPDVEKIIIYNVNGLGQNPDIRLSANNHLPSLWVSDFFKALCSFFCCHIKVNDKEHFLDISWKKTVFESPNYRDWREKMVSVIDQSFSNDDGYTLSSQVEKSNGESNPIPVLKDEVIIGAGKIKIEAKAGTLEVVREPMPYRADLWDIPIDKRAGNLPVQPTATTITVDKTALTKQQSSFPLCFLFTHGRYEFSVKYPQGNSEGSSFRLKVSGNKGLYNYAHKQWLKKTFAARTIKARLFLNENDLHNLHDEDIILIKSSNGVCVHCLIKKIIFTSFRHQTGVLAEAEMIVLDSERP